MGGKTGGDTPRARHIISSALVFPRRPKTGESLMVAPVWSAEEKRNVEGKEVAFGPPPTRKTFRPPLQGQI